MPAGESGVTKVNKVLIDWLINQIQKNLVIFPKDHQYKDDQIGKLIPKIFNFGFRIADFGLRRKNGFKVPGSGFRVEMLYLNQTFSR